MTSDDPTPEQSAGPEGSAASAESEGSDELAGPEGSEEEYEVTLGDPAADEPPEAEEAPAAGSSAARPRTSLARPGMLLALLGLVVAVVAAIVLVPRLLADDPHESLGDDESPARKVVAALSGDMTCDSGQISDKRSVLACYRQDAETMSIVFLQADHDGRVASYTAETREAAGGHAHDGAAADEHTVELANRVAAVVTPGTGFDDCTHDRSTPYFCFGEVATWEAEDLAPAQTTGEKKRLPTVEQLDERYAADGWKCSYGICTKGEAAMTVEQPLTGLGLQYGGKIATGEIPSTVGVLLELTDDAEELREWAATLDGRLSILVADRFVAGYLPQGGGTGLFVIDEVAGVLPDAA